MTKPSVTWITWDGEPARDFLFTPTVYKIDEFRSRFFGRLDHWLRDRPTEPAAAVAAWGDACVAVGGTFIPDATTASEADRRGIFVPGTGWCRGEGTGLDLALFGGWFDASSLAQKENLTIAAALHHFIIMARFTSLVPGKEMPNATTLVRRTLSAGSQSNVGDQENVKRRVVRLDVRTDPTEANCAVGELETFIDIPAIRQFGTIREVRNMRECVASPHARYVIVMEMSLLSDAAAARRGAPVRDQLDRILASASFRN